MKKAYSYIRFSSPEQLKGDSLRRQIDLAKKYAADNGLVFDDSMNLQDLGLSAYSGKHRSDQSALGQFLKLVEMGKIEEGSVLLVESLDRLSREEILEALEQFLGIIRNGIKIVTLIDNREYSQETINFNELIISITIMARAHEESATKAMRLGKAWEGKRKDAKFKKLTARCPAWLHLNEDRTQFNIIKERKEVICQIFDMKLSGMGATAIVRELNSRHGIWKPESRDKRKSREGWRESYVKKILKNPAVIGEFQPHRLLNGKRQPIGESIPDYYPPIVDKGIFYQVQEQLNQNVHKGGQTGIISNLFTHIIKCGYCGGSLAYVNKGVTPSGGQYLVCDRARRGLGCFNATIKYIEFEQVILTYCIGLNPQDFLVENDKIVSNICLLQRELESIVAELNSTIANIDNIAGSIASTSDKRVREHLENVMSEKFDKKSSLEKKAGNLKQQIKTLSNSSETTQLTIDSLRELLSFLSNTKQGEKLVDVRLKIRNELRKLITRIDVYPEGDPHYSTIRMQDQLDFISMTVSEEDALKACSKLKEYYQQRINNPKAFSLIKIYFISGNYRFIMPKRVPQLSAEFNKEERILYA